MWLTLLVEWGKTFSTQSVDLVFLGRMLWRAPNNIVHIYYIAATKGKRELVVGYIGKGIKPGYLHIMEGRDESSCDRSTTDLSSEPPCPSKVHLPRNGCPPCFTTHCAMNACLYVSQAGMPVLCSATKYVYTLVTWCISKGAIDRLSGCSADSFIRCCCLCCGTEMRRFWVWGREREREEKHINAEGMKCEVVNLTQPLGVYPTFDFVLLKCDLNTKIVVVCIWGARQTAIHRETQIHEKHDSRSTPLPPLYRSNKEPISL